MATRFDRRRANEGRRHGCLTAASMLCSDK
jgi:hypothetical protein